MRQLAAIMFVDMAGYTALMQENEHTMVGRYDEAFRIAEKQLEINPPMRLALK